MRSIFIRSILIIVVALPAAGCGDGDTVPATGRSTTSIALPSALTGGGSGCSSDAVVTIGLYADASCTAGTETATIDVDTTESCVVWPGGGSISASACYTDRVCMTHVGGDACDTGTPVAAQASLTACVAGPGGAWMRVLSGTENCPEAPDGFVCEATPLEATDDEVCPLVP